MQLLTNWVLGPVWQGILLSIIFYLIPFGTLFAIVIGLFVTLRQGVLKGLVVGLSSAVLVVLIRLLLGGLFAELDFNLLIQSLYWVMLLFIPSWLFAVLLRQVVSLSYTLQIMTLLSMAVFAVCFYGNYSLFPDSLSAPINEHVNKLTIALIETQEQSNTKTDSGLSITPENIEAISRSIGYVFEVMSLYTTIMMLLLLARSWQSYMFMPNEFSKEFRSIRTGSVITTLLVTGLVLDLFTNSELYDYIFGGALFIGSIWLIISGVAFVHWLAYKYKLSWKTMAIFYLSLCLPIVSVLLLILLILIGLTDGFINLRDLVTRTTATKI